jgi:PPOX class probable F420-dependent enzyme
MPELTPQVRLTPKVREICEKQAFVHLATLMPDGSPQVTPTWVELEGDRIVINTARGRIKHRNVERDPRVALSVTDPDNPYSAVWIRGRVVEIVEDENNESINRLARKYLGEERYPWLQPGEVRLKLYIEAERIGGMP